MSIKINKPYVVFPSFLLKYCLNTAGVPAKLTRCSAVKNTAFQCLSICISGRSHFRYSTSRMTNSSFCNFPVLLPKIRENKLLKQSIFKNNLRKILRHTSIIKPLFDTFKLAFFSAAPLPSKVIPLPDCDPSFKKFVKYSNCMIKGDIFQVRCSYHIFLAPPVKCRPGGTKEVLCNRGVDENVQYIYILYIRTGSLLTSQFSGPFHTPRYRPLVGERYRTY